MLQNKCLYQVPNCFGNIASKKSKHKFYNSTVQEISKGGGDCATKVGSLCACFVDMGDPVKTQVENCISKIFGFQGQTIDVSDQAVFHLNCLGLRD